MSLADGIHTLTNVVITYYTQIYLILEVVSFCGVITIVRTQANEGLYHNQHPMYVFLPFAREVFDCLHQQVNIFFHQPNDMEWSTKCSGEPPLSYFACFL